LKTGKKFYIWKALKWVPKLWEYFQVHVKPINGKLGIFVKGCHPKSTFLSAVFLVRSSSSLYTLIIMLSCRYRCHLFCLSFLLLRCAGGCCPAYVLLKLPNPPSHLASQPLNSDSFCYFIVFLYYAIHCLEIYLYLYFF
jgi:hypothetical protein